MQNEERINCLEGKIKELEELVLNLKEQVSSDVIRAKQFEVENDDGVTVGVISSYEGDGIIRMLDKNGKSYLVTIPVYLPNGKSSGCVTTLNSDGEDVVTIGAHEYGGGVIVTDGNGHEMVRIGVSEQSTGVIRTLNNKGHDLVTISLNYDGEGYIETTNGSGIALNAIGASKGRGSLFINDENGKAIVIIASDDQGNGSIITLDGNSKLLVSMLSSTEPQLGGGMITTYNHQGRDLVEIGMTVKGDGSVTIKNPDKKDENLAVLFANEIGGMAQTMNREGRPLVYITSQSDGKGAVVTLDGMDNVTSAIPTS